MEGNLNLRWLVQNFHQLTSDNKILYDSRMNNF
jgi:hypothetical protein